MFSAKTQSYLLRQAAFALSVSKICWAEHKSKHPSNLHSSYAHGAKDLTSFAEQSF